MNPSQTNALWIGSAHPFDLHEVYLDFRSPLELAFGELPHKANFYITADSRYQLWVNGQFVGRGPARCWPHRQSVDCLDVTPYLCAGKNTAGKNTIAVQLYQPGYSHFSYLHRGSAGLLAWLDCDGETVLRTDATWKVRRNASFSDQVRRVSLYGSGVEERTLNLLDGWRDDPVYDASGWENARVVAAADGALWTGLVERQLPLLSEREHPMRLAEFRAGCAAQAAAPDAGLPDPHWVVRAGWPVAEAATPERGGDGFFTQTLAAGESAYWLFDLGRNYTVQGWAEIVGGNEGGTLTVTYLEKMRDGQLVISDPETYCRVGITDRFWMGVGDTIAESFSLRGGRYLLFGVHGPADAIRVRFHARVAEYPLEVSKPLATSDPQLAGVVTLCEETMRACLQETFVDCNWRESSQWLGDALPQALLMHSMCDDVRPLRSVIEMAADGAYPDGVLPSILPGEVHAYCVVDYNFTWVELLKLYHELTSDDAFAFEMWPALTKMLDRFHQDVGALDLIVSQPGRRLFIDWSPISRSEPNAVYNLRYLLALQTAAALATVLNRADDVALWQERAEQVQKAIRNAFWLEGRWFDDVERTTFSQQAAALALLTKSTLADEEEALFDAIAARSLNPSDEPETDLMVLASPFMHHYIFEALRSGGRDDEVLEIIKLRWGRWVEAGYPTAWENWAVDFPDGSQCHAFSAHPRYHLAEIGRRRTI